METAPSHVALLVPSVENAASVLRPLGFAIGKTEEWEGEGTREIYVEHGKGNSLLLMEPIKPGAYRRAMEKRGPGLHHLAIDVLKLEDFIASVAQSGWLLHPNSLKTIKASRTAYLARPGFPGLIEVQEYDEINKRELFVEEISLSFEASLERLLPSLHLQGVVRSSTFEPYLILAGQKVLLRELF
jgi:hypothetical protein